MPAYFDTGFSVRKPMWHGLGSVLDEYPKDWADARRLAGLEWEPRVIPMFRQVDAPLGFGVTGPRLVEVPGHKLVERDDTHHVFGSVTDSWSPIYHSTMGEILDAMLGQGLKLETAGSIMDGAKVWALAYLDEPIVIAGDDTETYPFVALLNSHDGKGACSAIATSVRVVCWNTYQAATLQGEKSGLSFTFRHTGNVSSRIDEAKEAMAAVRGELSAWASIATELSTLNVTDEQVQLFIEEFIAMPPPATCSDRVVANVEKARAMFKHLYFDSVTTNGHRGTALGLVDASVEYLDHVRGYRNQDTYMGRTLLRPEPLKARAVNLVHSITA